MNNARTEGVAAPRTGRVVRLLLATAALLFSGTAAAAASWTPELAPPPTDAGFYAPTDSYRIHVPPEVPVEVLKRLALELDRIDVTAFVTRDGEYAVFSPPKPLEPGKHNLRIVEYLPDGTVAERGHWEVEVRGSPRFREAEFHSNLELTNTQRVADYDLTDPPGRNQTQGSWDVGGSVADGDWRLAANGQVMHNTQRDQMPNGETPDLTSFLVEGDKGPVSAHLGDHTVQADSLVLRDFARRGVSADARVAPLRSRITAFDVRTEAVSGLKYGLGLNDDHHRADGLVWTFNPVTDDPEAFQLQGVYLNAVGSGAAPVSSSGSTSTGGNTELMRGSADALVAESRLWQQRLHLRGEYAVSNNDFDGSGTALSSERDDAYTLAADYTHPQFTALDAAFSWNLGGEYRDLGPLFYSLGNPGENGDVALARGFTGFAWGGWSSNLEVARQHDNVDNDPTLPTLVTDNFTFGSTWTPRQDQPSGGLFAQPSFGLVAQRMYQHHEDIPTAFTGVQVDQTTRVLTLNAAFSPASWSWNLGYTRTWFDDSTGQTVNYTNDLASLGANLLLGERVTLGPQLQYNLLDQSGDATVRTLTAMLNAAFIIVPERVNANLDYSYNHQWASDDSVDSIVQTLGAELNWNAIVARNNHPGLAVFLRGNLQNTNDYGSTSAVGTPDPYQVFAGVRVGWPVAY